MTTSTPPAPPSEEPAARKHAVDVTEDDFFNSLNGYDEDAIENAFGQVITKLLQKSGSAYLRGLIYIERQRAGLKAAEAKKFAQGLRYSELRDYFAEDEERLPDEPTTNQGKDD